MSKKHKPKPVIEIGAFECRAVIGDVVRRGVSMMCGKPIVQNAKFKFCKEHTDAYIVSPHANGRHPVSQGTP